MSALVPPFTRETAIAKIRMAEDAWNSRATTVTRFLNADIAP